MARSTYQDQIENLIAKGYLVQRGANSFDFYEVPKPRHGNNQNPVSAVGSNFEECTSDGTSHDLPVQTITAEDIEINNTATTTKSRTNSSDLSRETEVKIPDSKHSLTQLFCGFQTSCALFCALFVVWLLEKSRKSTKKS